MRAFRSTETVRCGDDEYTLAIDIEIIDALEDEFGGLGFDKLLEESVGKGRVGKTARLLRGLLIRHHPDLHIDEAGALAMDHGQEIGEAIERLILKALPEPEEAKDENPPNAHRGTGASSSSRGARPASRRQSSGAKRPALSS
jgi:hypothetical protein